MPLVGLAAFERAEKSIEINANINLNYANGKMEANE